MKTKEELNAIREEIASLATKLKELSEDELEAVGGGYTLGDLAATILCQTQITPSVWDAVEVEKKKLVTGAAADIYLEGKDPEISAVNRLK